MACNNAYETLHTHANKMHNMKSKSLREWQCIDDILIDGCVFSNVSHIICSLIHHTRQTQSTQAVVGFVSCADVVANQIPTISSFAVKSSKRSDGCFALFLRRHWASLVVYAMFFHSFRVMFGCRAASFTYTYILPWLKYFAQINTNWWYVCHILCIISRLHTKRNHQYTENTVMCI